MADLETSNAARSADTGSKLATLGQVKNVLDYSKNEITELKGDLSTLSSDGYLPHNILTCDVTWIGSSTQSGLSYTGHYNSNGVFISLDVNGTATSFNYFKVKETPFTLPKGKYKLIGCPDGGSASTYRIYIEKTAGGNIVDIGSGIEFELTEETEFKHLIIAFGEGTVCNNLTFTPQILTNIEKMWQSDFDELNRKIGNAQSYWKGKKIVWFGTSIPDGGYDGTRATAYPDMIGTMIGATVYNESVGSMQISDCRPDYITDNNPYGFNTDYVRAYKCLTNTIEMENWLISNWNNSYFTNRPTTEPNTSLQEFMKGMSYENKVFKYLDGGSVGNVDLYVFDIGINDSRDFQTSYNWENMLSTYGQDTRYAFVGGMNFLIRQILTKNPDAKIILISHYSKNYQLGHDKLFELHEIVSRKWGLKLVDIADMLGWSGEEITTNGYWGSDNIWHNSGGDSQTIKIAQMHLRDGLHPYTDASGKSNNRIADIICAEINNIVR